MKRIASLVAAVLLVVAGISAPAANPPGFEVSPSRKMSG
jgi:hypothetical protein